jgi:hypothetical protein
MAKAPKASFEAEPHELQAEHDAAVERLAELQLNPANSWHIERAETYIAALADVIEGRVVD